VRRMKSEVISSPTGAALEKQVAELQQRLEDVTSRLTAEREAYESLVHDLSQPATAITMNVEFLLENADELDLDSIHALREAAHSAKEIGNFVQDLLTIAHGEQAGFEPKL